MLSAVAVDTSADFLLVIESLLSILSRMEFYCNNKIPHDTKPSK